MKWLYFNAVLSIIFMWCIEDLVAISFEKQENVRVTLELE